IHKYTSFGSANIPTIAASITSRFSTWEARAAIRTTLSTFLSTVNLFKVRVPVLSQQSTSMPAISTIALILFVITPCNNRWEPIAIVTDKTVGMAIGIPPIRSTSKFLSPVRYSLC
ncbi:hypothetical protein CISIN_1g039515mg, partial [Citrus sinensis]